MAEERHHTALRRVALLCETCMSLRILLRDGSCDRSRVGSRARDERQVRIKQLTGRHPHGNRQAARETVAETLEARVERLDSSDAEFIERAPADARDHRRQGCRCSVYCQIVNSSAAWTLCRNTVARLSDVTSVRTLTPTGSASGCVSTRRQLGNIAPRAQDQPAPVCRRLATYAIHRNILEAIECLFRI